MSKIPVYREGRGQGAGDREPEIGTGKGASLRLRRSTENEWKPPIHPSIPSFPDFAGICDKGGEDRRLTHIGPAHMWLRSSP